MINVECSGMTCSKWCGQTGVKLETGYCGMYCTWYVLHASNYCPPLRSPLQYKATTHESINAYKDKPYCKDCDARSLFRNRRAFDMNTATMIDRALVCC